MSPDLPVYIMLGFGLAGIVSIIIWLGFLTQNKDNGPEIKKNLGIVAAVTAILVGVFGGAAYLYFNANLNSLPPFLLVMTFINLFLSTLAVSASSLQITYS
jgi:hypothetical protein